MSEVICLNYKEIINKKKLLLFKNFKKPIIDSRWRNGGKGK